MALNSWRIVVRAQGTAKALAVVTGLATHAAAQAQLAELDASYNLACSHNEGTLKPFDFDVVCESPWVFASNMKDEPVPASFSGIALTFANQDSWIGQSLSYGFGSDTYATPQADKQIQSALPAGSGTPLKKCSSK